MTDLALCDNLDVVQNMYLGREVRDFLFRLKEPVMEQRTAETLRSLAVSDDLVDWPARSFAVRSAEAVRRRREGRAVELPPGHPRRTDGGARCRADPPGARARRAARRPGPGRRSHLRTTSTTSSRWPHGSPSSILVGTSVLNTHQRRSRRSSTPYRGHPDEGRRHRRERAGDRVVSTDAEIVAPGIGLPEEGGAERARGGSGSAQWTTSSPAISASCRSSSARSLIVMYFSFTATNFFAASNFVNVVLQMAGVTMMIAFGVVFVLLIAEIDLSIGYLRAASRRSGGDAAASGRSELSRLVVHSSRARRRGHVKGGVQGTVVAKIGVPSFVVTASQLSWQGVILRELQTRGVIQIEEDWINKTATYYSPPRSAGSSPRSSPGCMRSLR